MVSWLIEDLLLMENVKWNLLIVVELLKVCSF